MIKKQLKTELEGYEREARQLQVLMAEVLKETEQAVTDFSKKEFAPFMVAEKVLSLGFGSGEALTVVHTAMFKTQEVLTFLKLQVLPKLIGVGSDIKALAKLARTRVSHDDKWDNVKISNVQKEAELEYILMDICASSFLVDKDFKKAKGYIDWVQEQYDYALRLESGVRLGERIEDSLRYQGVGVNSGTIEF